MQSALLDIIQLAPTASSRHSIRSVRCLITSLLLPCCFPPTHPSIPTSIIPITRPANNSSAQEKQMPSPHITSQLPPPPNNSPKPSSSHHNPTQPHTKLYFLFPVCLHASRWPHLTTIIHMPGRWHEPASCVCLFVCLKSMMEGDLATTVSQYST